MEKVESQPVLMFALLRVHFLFKFLGFYFFFIKERVIVVATSKKEEVNQHKLAQLTQQSIMTFTTMFSKIFALL